MTEAQDPIRDFFSKHIADFRTARDEMKLKLHLAGMDAKQAWSELEPRLAAFEKEAAQVTEATAQATVDATKEVVSGLVSAIEELRAGLAKTGEDASTDEKG